MADLLWIYTHVSLDPEVWNKMPGLYIWRGTFAQSLHTEVLVVQTLVTDEQVVWYILGVRQNVKSRVLTCDPI